MKREHNCRRLTVVSYNKFFFPRAAVKQVKTEVCPLAKDMLKFVFLISSVLREHRKVSIL
jgi:hypothetical protein